MNTLFSTSGRQRTFRFYGSLWFSDNFFLSFSDASSPTYTVLIILFYNKSIFMIITFLWKESSPLTSFSYKSGPGYMITDTFANDICNKNNVSFILVLQLQSMNLYSVPLMYPLEMNDCMSGCIFSRIILANTFDMFNPLIGFGYRYLLRNI